MSSWSDHSLAFALQSAFGTPNTTDGDFAAIDGEFPKVSFETPVTEVETMTGVVGASPRRLVGSRRGKLTFKMGLEGFITGYAPASENPGGVPATVGSEVIPLWLALAGNAMGSNNSAVSSMANFVRGLGLSNSEYTAAGMASGTASAITCDDAAASNKIDAGQLVVAALSTDPLAPQIGFAKAKAGQVVTLFEAAKNDVNDAAADLYGTSTAYMSAEVSAVHPVTFRWTGPTVAGATAPAAFCYELLDAVCEGVKGTWNVGEVPTVEFTYTFYDFRLNKLDGGLVVPTGYTEIPQIVGSVNGFATISGAQKCSLESCTWEWAATLRETKCHAATNGVSAVSVIKPRLKVGMSVLHDSEDLAFDAGGTSAIVGQHIYQSALELGSTVSVGAYVGTQVGKVWAMLLPAARIVAVPQVSLRDDQVAYQLEMEAGAYTGDSTDTAETTADSPIDSIGRISLG